jgi:antitoxin component of MazEF toxin-antitoxin module
MPLHAKLRLRKAGDSLIATIPKDVADRGGFRAGDEILATIETRDETLEKLAGSLPEQAGSEFDRQDVWGPLRH